MNLKFGGGNGSGSGRSQGGGGGGGRDNGGTVTDIVRTGARQSTPQRRKRVLMLMSDTGGGK